MTEGARGLNILCMDGGGARGLSSLVVLREIMHRINSKCGGKNGGIQPHEIFDVIAGTGTGGISACLLGRLQMPIDKAIETYAKLMESVFSEKKMSGRTMYKGTKLQEALKTMIRKEAGNEGEMMTDDRSSDGCKTIVFAMAKHNLNASIPVIFRSYQASTNPGPACTMWQALYATMAHPDLFKGIDIPDSSVPQSFIGGEIGCSNPLAHVLSEVAQVFPDRQVACIVSIGAGHARTIQAPDPTWWQVITRTQDVVVMKDMATDSERVAEEMGLRFRGRSGVYFRFNVDQGMQDVSHGSWERLGETMEHTKAYLQKNITNQLLEKAVDANIGRRGAIPTLHAAGQIPSASETNTEVMTETRSRTKGQKRIPAPTPVYTGREDENTQVISCITGTQYERRVCVVYGLGGVGKTQLVLNVIERTRDEWDHVLFVDASSNATAEEDMKEFANAKKIGDSHEDTIRWLESCREHWLVVFDNADIPSTNIRQYFPGGRHGSILVTTRLPDLARLAKGPGAVCHLSSMSDADGLALLIKTASVGGQPLSEGDLSAAKALLEDFGCLALAIVHAGAYIAHSPGMSFSKYRDLFLPQRQRMLEQYGDLPESAKLDDYGKTVYTTWKMCYDQLKPESRPILWLISYLHYSHISEDIFKRAAKHIGHKFPLPLTEYGSQALSHVHQCLTTFVGAEKHWDTVKFTNVMADLTSYSLISFDRTNLAYSIHIIVQDWGRTVIPQAPELAIECSATLISLSIDFKRDTESLAFKRRLGPHVTGLLEHGHEIGPNHAYYFDKVYMCTGQWIQRERLLLPVLEAFKRELGEDHPKSMIITSDLATTYSNQNRFNEAERVQVQVVEASKRVLGEDHKETLIRKANLVFTYRNLGRLDEAEKLQNQALESCKRLLGEEHRITLSSMAQLAATYLKMGRCDEAEQLRLKVLETRKRVLGEEHPRTLRGMTGLAQVYSQLDRWDEAVSLLTTASTTARIQLGTEHPETNRYSRWLSMAQQRQLF